MSKKYPGNLTGYFLKVSKMNKYCSLIRYLFSCSVLCFTIPYCYGQKNSDTTGWVNIFNGKNFDGWTIKIAGHPLNENYRNTFRVQNGILKICYDEYKTFNGEVAHLFYNKKLSHYKLRIQYRFIGEVTPGVPDWNIRNTGVVIYCQSAESMEMQQAYPVGLKAQFLGGNGKDKRTTGNVVNMGTTVVYNGERDSSHIINSTSKTFHGNQWVTIVIEVNANESIRHIIDKQSILKYEKPTLNENDTDAKKLIVNGDKFLREGFIALQGEGHPVEFRKVELLVLKE